MRRFNFMPETFDDAGALGLVESFLEISTTIAAMAVGASVCSALVTLAMIS
jgi:hypothetical protein